MEQEFVLFGFGEDVLVLRSVQLCRVLGGDKRNRLAGRYAEGRGDRIAVEALAGEEDGVVVRIQRPSAVTAAIEAVGDAGDRPMDGLAGGTMGPRSVEEER